MTAPTCPDEKTFAQLLAGLLPAEVAEPREQHLAHCAHCAERAQQPGLHDPLLEALRETTDGDDAVSVSDEPIVRDLIERLSGLTDRPVFAQTLSEDELRSILAPPQQDGELGRLGQHRVLEILGVGGMGIVFKAEDRQLGRIVALKVMKPELAASRTACRRFQREAVRPRRSNITTW